MKKLYSLIAIVCVLAATFSAQPVFAACSSTLGDTCIAVYTSNTNAGEGMYTFSSPTIYNGWCQPFTVDAGAANYYVTHAAFNIKKTGTPSGYGTLMWRIYDSSGGSSCASNLGALLGGNDNVTDTSNTSTYTLVDGPPTTNVQVAGGGHVYFLIASTTNANTSGSFCSTCWQGSISNSAPPYSAEYYKTDATFNQETGYNMTFEIDGKAAAPFAVNNFNPWQMLMGLGF